MRHRETHKTDSVGGLRGGAGRERRAHLDREFDRRGRRSHSRAKRHAGRRSGRPKLRALSMAAGEYVSVSSRSDSEEANLAQERAELATTPEAELAELTAIYVSRGLTPQLAHQVAVELTAHDALGAHARDELGIFDFTRARPVQAALTSAAAFACGRDCRCRWPE